MNTKDIAKPSELLTIRDAREPAYKLPLSMPQDFSTFISKAEAKLHAIIKENAAKFIAGEKIIPLEYEIKMLLKRVYDEGHDDGVKEGQIIQNL